MKSFDTTTNSMANTPDVDKKKFALERERAIRGLAEEIINRFDDAEIDRLIAELREKISHRVEN